MLTIFWIGLALAAVAALALVSIYNRLEALNRRCDQAGADIDVQLKQRHDLVPNLVATVKSYAGHERGTLEAVIKARAAAVAAPSAGAQMQAESMLGAALGRLMAVAEAYPELKASGQFSDLAAELGDLENKIAAARRYLNGATTEYNTTIEQFPANVIAGNFGFKLKPVAVAPNDNRAELDTAPVVQL